MLNEMEKKVIVGGFVKGYEVFCSEFGESLYNQVCRDPDYIRESLECFDNVFHNRTLHEYVPLYYKEESINYCELDKLSDSIAKIRANDANESDYKRLQKIPEINYINKGLNVVKISSLTPANIISYNIGDIGWTLDKTGLKSNGFYAIAGPTRWWKKLSCTKYFK